MIKYVKNARMYQQELEFLVEWDDSKLGTHSTWETLEYVTCDDHLRRFFSDNSSKIIDIIDKKIIVNIAGKQLSSSPEFAGRYLSEELAAFLKDRTRIISVGILHDNSFTIITNNNVLEVHYSVLVPALVCEFLKYEWIAYYNTITRDYLLQYIGKFSALYKYLVLPESYVPKSIMRKRLYESPCQSLRRFSTQNGPSCWINSFVVFIVKILHNDTDLMNCIFPNTPHFNGYERQALLRSLLLQQNLDIGGYLKPTDFWMNFEVAVRFQYTQCSHIMIEQYPVSDASQMLAVSYEPKNTVEFEEDICSKSGMQIPLFISACLIAQQKHTEGIASMTDREDVYVQELKDESCKICCVNIYRQNIYVCHELKYRSTPAQYHNFDLNNLKDKTHYTILTVGHMIDNQSFDIMTLQNLRQNNTESVNMLEILQKYELDTCFCGGFIDMYTNEHNYNTAHTVLFYICDGKLIVCDSAEYGDQCNRHYMVPNMYNVLQIHFVIAPNYIKLPVEIKHTVHEHDDVFDGVFSFEPVEQLQVVESQTVE